MIEHEWRERVLLVTIDRPDRRNAVDHEHLERLAATLDEAVEAQARAYVLTGAGGHFCAGADLKGLEDEGFAVVLRGCSTGCRRCPSRRWPPWTAPPWVPGRSWPRPATSG